MGKLCFVFIVFSLVIFLFLPILAHADSGWDSSYGDGSSSSSSSSSSDSSGSGGKDSNIELGVIELFLTICCGAYIFPVIGETLFKNQHIRNVFNDICIILRILYCVFMSTIMYNLGMTYLFIYLFIDLVSIIILSIYLKNVDIKRHPEKKIRYSYDEDVQNEIFAGYNLDKKELKKELFDKFVKIQYAWMNFDYDKLKELCTDELFNSYKSDLEVLKLKNGQNIMSDFELCDIHIYKIEEDQNNLILHVSMSVSFYDYVIDTKTDSVIRGNENKLITNNYLMTFIKGKNESDIVICPSCGKETHINTRSECEYCHSVLVKKPNNFVLSNKKRIDR